MERKHKPNWWLLYATVPLMIGLFVVESRIAGSEFVHRIVELGIVLLIFGLMALWVKTNEPTVLPDPASDGWLVDVDPQPPIPPGARRLSDTDPHWWTIDLDDVEASPHSPGLGPRKGRYN